MTDSPGGARLPVLEGKAAAKFTESLPPAPETTFADETLCLTGSNLDGIDLKLWSENGLTDLPPLRSAPDRVQVVLPKDLAPSTLLLWPQKGGKTAAPFRVNGASVWWTWPHRVQPGKDGAVPVSAGISRCPDRNRSASSKQAERNSAWRCCTTMPITSRPPCPKTSPRARSASGHTTAPAASLVGAIRHPLPSGSRPHAPEREFRLDNLTPPPPGRGDCSPAISRAIEALAEAGGGVIVFGKRTYVIEKDHQPSQGRAPMVLRGSGMGSYDAFSTDDLGKGGTVITDWIAGPKSAEFRRRRRRDDHPEQSRPETGRHDRSPRRGRLAPWPSHL